MKNLELKMPIQELTIDSLVWNVYGLAPIVSIVKVGYSELLGSYCHAKTRFSETSTMSFFICQNKAILKDGYLCNTDYLQFIPTHKVIDFI